MSYNTIMANLSTAQQAVADVIGDAQRDQVIESADPVQLILAIGMAASAATLCGMILAELGDALQAFTGEATDLVTDG
jgi:hypothetical protein